MQLHRTEGLENEFPPRHNGGSVGLCCFRKGASSPWCLLCPRHLCNADLKEAVVYRSPCCDYFPNLPKMTIELNHLSEFSFLRTMKMWNRGILVKHCFSYEFLDYSCFCSSWWLFLFVLLTQFLSLWMSFIFSPGSLFKSPHQHEFLRHSRTWIPYIPGS